MNIEFREPIFIVSNPETIPLRHKKHRQRSFSQEMGLWPIKHIDKKFSRFLPPNHVSPTARHVLVLQV